MTLEKLKIPTNFWKFFGLYESVEKVKCLSEKLFDENV